jgi:hypothetical protein
MVTEPSRSIDKRLILAIYQLAHYLLQSYPNLDTLEGTERKHAVDIRAALVAFTRATECKFGLPHTKPTRIERRE